MSLSNLAVGLMLRTYGKLKKVNIKDDSDAVLGNSNISWESPLADTIKTLPFTILITLPTGTTKQLKTIDISGITPNPLRKTNLIGETTNDNLNFYTHLINAYESELQENVNIIHGVKFGNKAFDFILYRTNLTSPINGITHQNLTGTYSGTNDNLVESLYTFVDGKISIGTLTKMFSIRVNTSSSGSYYFFVVPMKTMYETTTDANKLTYNLSNFGYNDTVDKDTLVKLPNGIQERLEKS